MKIKSKFKKWLRILTGGISLLAAGLFMVFLLLISGSFQFFLGLIFVLFSLVLFYVVFNVKFKVPRSAVVIPAGLLILGLIFLSYSWNKRTSLVDYTTLIKVGDQYVGGLVVSEEVFNNEPFFTLNVTGNDLLRIGNLHGSVEIEAPDNKYTEKIDQLNNIGLFGGNYDQTHYLTTYSQKLKLKISRPGKYMFKVNTLAAPASNINFVNINLERHLKPFEFILW